MSILPGSRDSFGGRGWRSSGRAAWLAAAALVAAGPAWAQVTLVAEGEPAATIVVGASATEVEQEAAKALQTYVQRMSGAQLPVVAEPNSVRGTTVSVGLTGRVDNATRERLLIGQPLFVADPRRDAFVTRTTEDGLVLVGHHDEATRYAVYDLLEGLGCRWFFACDAGEVIPSRKTITIARTDRLETPGFAHRFQYTWYGRTKETKDREAAWFAANRLKPRDALGFSGHNFGAIWPVKQYGEKYPEIYPLLKGKRELPKGGVDWQPCLSNPKTIELAVEWARKTLTEHPEFELITLAPNDGYGYCECEACAKLGNRADQNLYLGNQVLRAIKDEFPRVMVCIWAYADSAVIPTTKADGYDAGTDRILAAVYSIYSKTPFHELVAGWRKASHHLMVSHSWYFCNWHWDLALTPSRYPETLDDYRPLHDNGVRLLRLQVMGDWAKVGLDRYLSAKLMWNPTASTEALIRDFCTKMFPSASLEFYNFIRLYDTVDRKEDDPATFVRRGLYWLDRIRAKVRSDEERRRWRFYALYLHSIPLEQRFERAADNESKIAALKEVAAYMKGVEPYGVFESRRRVESQCFDKMTRLFGYSGKDRDLGEVPALTLDDAAIDRMFEQDRAALPPLSIVLEYEPLDWKGAKP